MLTESQVAPPLANVPIQQHSSSAVRTLKETQEYHTGEAAPPASKNVSFEVERANELFSIISARSDIDHPICAECTDLLLSSLTNRLQSATKERDAYIGFLKQLNNSIPSEEELASTQATLEKAQKLEASLFDELLKLEAEKEKLETSLGELEEESRALDEEENEFWQTRNAFTEKLSDLLSERSAIHNKYVHDAQQLERLQRSNVYNDTFCIGHDGLFGTINGLRLGRLPNQMVEWSEINAAWGLTLLCLATVAEKLAFEFQGYRLRPMGSTSRIDKLDYAQSGQQNHPPTPSSNQTGPSKPPRSLPTKIISLDLFSSGDLPLGRMFTHRRFDAGMVAFLDCLAQLGRHVEHMSRDAPNRAVVRLPYEIKGEKIGDVSIKLGAGFQQDENWTKACKHALTCCKFLLALASNMREGRDRSKAREKEQDKAGERDREGGKAQKVKKQR